MLFIDYLLLGIVVGSFFLGFFRGFLREAIALLAWLGGVWLAWRFASYVEPLLGGLVAHPPISTWVARALILCAVLVVAWVVGGVLAYFVHQSGVSQMLDRILGIIFGVLRAGALVAVVVMLAKEVRLDECSWWQRSRLLPYAVELSGWVRTYADAAIATVYANH